MEDIGKEPDGYIRPAPGTPLKVHRGVPSRVYRLTQGCNRDWNTYDTCVVIAASKGDARRIHPSGDSDNWRSRTWVSRSEIGKINAVEIGIANEKWKAGTVICASFTAG